MPTRKRFIEADVLTEAKRRLHHIYDIHDSVVVAFSGGKDSLAALHLTHEVASERGIDHVHAIFRDEELIPHEVVDFVQGYRELDWLDLRWFGVPLQSHLYILGRMIPYVQWDPSRAHVRELPDFAITLDDLGLPADTVLSQYEMDELSAAPFKGKVALVNGIRAAESLIRFASCVNKLNENYLNGSSSKRVTFAKPIFDWQENDVFRYFYDREIAYCPYYDAQLYANQSYRVCSILCSEPAKHFASFRATAPELYEQVMQLFPEMQVQERYWSGFDKKKAHAAGSYADVRAWIEAELESPFREKALEHVNLAEVMDGNDPGTYPPSYCLHAVQNGQGTKRPIQPLHPSKRMDPQWA